MEQKTPITINEFDSSFILTRRELLGRIFALLLATFGAEETAQLNNFTETKGHEQDELKPDSR